MSLVHTLTDISHTDVHGLQTFGGQESDEGKQFFLAVHLQHRTTEKVEDKCQDPDVHYSQPFAQKWWHNPLTDNITDLAANSTTKGFLPVTLEILIIFHHFSHSHPHIPQ